MANDLSPVLLAALARVTTRRGKVVVNHILKHGQVSTEQLEDDYHLRDAASAARDVKDAGVPLISTRGRSKTGRAIAIYSFGDPADVRQDRVGGRKAFSKQFKLAVIERYGLHCGICLTPYEARYLQVDHRIPFQIAGDSPSTDRDVSDYMLLCGSCQRAKSWSCEHCDNWREGRLAEICKSCYWASPESYTLIALKDHRRLEIVWLGEVEVTSYAGLAGLAKRHAIALPVYAKAALAEFVRRADGQP